jgi:hypothetical protein
MLLIAKYTIILFGLFLIIVSLMMLFAPIKARFFLLKAGSTVFINYAEITIRMIPAIAMVIFAEHSKCPDILNVFGWFMIGTSFILYLVPRRIHHNYAVRWSNILKNNYIRILSPLSLAFGLFLITCVK